MRVEETKIPGVVIIEPAVYGDERGYFFESYSMRAFDEAVGRHVEFVQDNESRSRRGVVRGLHFQLPPDAQAKLVRVVEGSVVDVAVDLRRGSPTYGEYVMVELTSDNHRQLFLPRGMAHGFAVTSEYATLLYKVDSAYAPESDSGIDPYDATLGVAWPVGREEAILSEKDKKRQAFLSFESPYEYEKK